MCEVKPELEIIKITLDNVDQYYKEVETLYKSAFDLDISKDEMVDYGGTMAGESKVYVRDGEVLGYIAYGSSKIRNEIGYIKSNIAMLYEVCVKESYRGNGLGSSMVSDAIEILNETIEVFPIERSLVNYYTRFGFKLKHAGDDNQIMIRECEDG